MKCEIIRNGRVLVSEMEFEASRVRDIIARQGGDYRLVPNALFGPVQIGGITILPVEYVYPEITASQKYGEPVRTESASKVVYAYAVETKDAATLRSEIERLVSAAHDAYDSGRMEYQGVSIAVDLEARVNAEGVLKRFERGLLTATRWNGQPVYSENENGESVAGPSRIDITSTGEMQAMYDAIFRHLEVGFIAKEIQLAEVAALSDEDLAEYSAGERWNEIVASL